MSATLLLIETSTESCSVAICKDEKVVSHKYTLTPKLHAKELAPFINEALSEAQMTLAECSAVCVSSGPGSYTGLRVGVSTAKGICFGANKPLIGVDTLKVLAMQGVGKTDADLIIPMIDARRMEVYSATFSLNGEKLTDTQALILTPESFSENLKERKVLFIGNGVEKFKNIICSPNAHFISCMPDATGMVSPALESFAAERFEDVAYFEPFYLKEFVAGISKKSLF